jgi:hypothetical protein
VIPRAHITAWRATAPWATDAQVEQDLVLSRALVEICADPLLAGAGVRFSCDFCGRGIVRLAGELPTECSPLVTCENSMTRRRLAECSRGER